MAQRLSVTVVSFLWILSLFTGCASHREAGQASAQPQAQPMAPSEPFGGQPRDDDARARHHAPYPDEVQHLGPQADQPTAAEQQHATDGASESQPADGMK